MLKNRSNSWFTVLSNLLLPVGLGLAVYFVLIGAIERGLWDNEYLQRYITGHPVSKVTTAMFLVGMAALLLVGAELLDQFRTLGKISLRPVNRRKPKRRKSKRLQQSTSDQGSEPVADHIETVNAEVTAGKVLSEEAALMKHLSGLEQRLQEHPRRYQSLYLWKRLQSALQFVRQHKSAGGLDDELKYLSDSDADQKHERYSLVRILIWATPMLGFLGTVLGISEALGGISVGQDNDFQSMMSGLQSSLYIAFDTTALALTFSIILMFVQFLADRFESQLLLAVDQRTKTELNQQFEISFEREDSYLQAINKMGSDLIAVSEELVQKQCELWNHSIISAQNAWSESLQASRDATQNELCEAIGQSAELLNREVTLSLEKADKTLEHRIQQWQVALSDLARKISSQQELISQQTEAVVDASELFENVGKLQLPLVEYLKTLPDSKSLIEASEKLATAVRLLEYRMGQEDNRQTPGQIIAEKQKREVGRELKIWNPANERKAA